MGDHHPLGDRFECGGYRHLFWLFVVPHYISIRSTQRLIFDQVVYPIINGEGEGGEPPVGNFVVFNVDEYQDYTLLVK